MTQDPYHPDVSPPPYMPRNPSSAASSTAFSETTSPTSITSSSRPTRSLRDTVDASVLVDREASRWNIAWTSSLTSSSAAHTATARNDSPVALSNKLPPLPEDYNEPVSEPFVELEPRKSPVPSLNILIQIVGSRGDVQPYLSMAIELILSPAKHRVRLATHDEFEDFVVGQGRRVLISRLRARGRGPFDESEVAGRLEFFPIGGDPKELMAYMVKNPGLLPGMESLGNGDIGRKRKMIKTIMASFLRSTYEPDRLTGRPFKPDAMLCNPPSFAHVHLAERFASPLVMSFTMPWSPTAVFSHPLVNLNQKNVEPSLAKYFSYTIAEVMTWQGLSSVTNQFRKGMGLLELANREGPGMADRLKIPHLYTWSKQLFPKPFDWKNHIEVTGYCFLEDQDYQPPFELNAFLNAGPPPIYIGFGSIVVDDVDALTSTILGAIQKAGVRALVSAGWSKISSAEVSDDVFIIGNVPHEWLFSSDRVAAVCHHGGAGTTACGLRHGRPTIVVPFFGDQPWQGAMVAASGAGPLPIPFKELSVDRLADAITDALSPARKQHAADLGQKISDETGEMTGVAAFHSHLPLGNMRCHLIPSEVATYWLPSQALRLSIPSAEVLVSEGLVMREELQLHRTREYDRRRGDLYPFAGVCNAVFNTVINFIKGFAMLFYRPHIGLWKVLTTLPLGLYYTWIAMGDSLFDLPKFWGSPNQPSEADGVREGFRSGGLGFLRGFRDGILGVFLTPIRRYKEAGWRGLVLGILQALLDLGVKGMAGCLRLFSQPVKGVVFAAKRRDWNKEHPWIGPSQELGMEALLTMDSVHRRTIVKAYKDSDSRSEIRRQELRQMKAQQIKLARKEQSDLPQWIVRR